VLTPSKHSKRGKGEHRHLGGMPACTRPATWHPGSPGHHRSPQPLPARWPPLRPAWPHAVRSAHLLELADVLTLVLHHLRRRVLCRLDLRGPHAFCAHTGYGCVVQAGAAHGLGPRPLPPPPARAPQSAHRQHKSKCAGGYLRLIRGK